MNSRIIVSLIPSILLWLSSCASLKGSLEEKAPPDPFSRTYSFAFTDFYPKLHQALQKYVQEKPGNSFQVTRLGSDGVVIRGLYRKERDAPPFPMAIIVKPSGGEKTRVDIRIYSQAPAATLESFKIAASDIFQIIEKETGILLR